jgi:hypothetical protein
MLGVVAAGAIAPQLIAKAALTQGPSTAERVTQPFNLRPDVRAVARDARVA